MFLTCLKLDTGSLFNTSFSGIRYMTLTTGHQHQHHHQIIIHQRKTDFFIFEFI